MLQQYKTIAGYGEDEIVIERSRFIGYAQRVTSEEEAAAFIAMIKKKHWDATHNCSAFVIGENDQIQRSSDDGEPSGTAGKPILECIKKNGVKDTAVVVTRYFGGIKLGAAWSGPRLYGRHGDRAESGRNRRPYASSENLRQCRLHLVGQGRKRAADRPAASRRDGLYGQGHRACVDSGR